MSPRKFETRNLLTMTGNYLILPLGLIYGRRFAAILAIVVNFAATIGCAVSQNFQQHFALRIIQGLATGATESVSDLSWKWYALNIDLHHSFFH